MTDKTTLLDSFLSTQKNYDYQILLMQEKKQFKWLHSSRVGSFLNLINPILLTEIRPNWKDNFSF